MPRITAIKPQKSKKRVNIYLDDKFGFGLDLENFVTLSLKVEQELSEGEVKEIIKNAEFQKTIDKLLRFAMIRPRSEKEIKDWFRRKEVPEQLHGDLLKKITKLELLDDKAFARWWVDQRQQFRPKARRVLQNELRIKGIDKEIITQVLEETEIDEEKIASEELVKRSYKWRGIDEKTRRQKMSEFLLRKGYSWEVVKKLTNKKDFD